MPLKDWISEGFLVIMHITTPGCKEKSAVELKSQALICTYCNINAPLSHILNTPLDCFRQYLNWLCSFYSCIFYTYGRAKSKTQVREEYLKQSSRSLGNGSGRAFLFHLWFKKHKWNHLPLYLCKRKNKTNIINLSESTLGKTSLLWKQCWGITDRVTF